jgi:hypothetical protein
MHHGHRSICGDQLPSSADLRSGVMSALIRHGCNDYTALRHNANDTCSSAHDGCRGSQMSKLWRSIYPGSPPSAIDLLLLLADPALHPH